MRSGKTLLDRDLQLGTEPKKEFLNKETGILLSIRDHVMVKICRLLLSQVKQMLEITGNLIAK